MKSEIGPLTGIRGIFALVVLAFHCGIVFPANVLIPTSIFRYGYISVDAFFILSGFILSHVHGQEMLCPNWRIVRDFFIARFARIYPLHLLTFGALAISLMIGAHLGFSPHLQERYSVAATVANLFLVHAWIGMSATWDTTSWTLSCEFAAYLTFPLLAFAAVRSRLFVPASLIVFIVAIWVFKTYAYTNPIKIFPEFLLGMAIYKLPKIPKHRADLAFCLSAVTSFVAMAQGYLPLAVIMFGAMIIALRDAGGAFSGLLRSRAMLYLGNISYALYLWQGVTLLVVKHSWNVLGNPETSASQSIATLVAIVLTFVCAAISHSFFEVPMRKLIRRQHRPTLRGLVR